METVGDRYQLLRKIGQGGSGCVWLARDIRLAVSCVVKEIRPSGEEDGDQTRQQFVSEINIIRGIQHPNIPRILDVFSEDDSLMVVMERVQGEDLEQYVKRTGPVSEEELVDWGLQLASILSYLHGRQQPILHLDLKPANVIRHPSGRLYLIDFGAAGKKNDRLSGEDLRGTPCYAAPEQYGGGIPPDERTDIFGLGRTLAFCLTDSNGGGRKFSAAPALQEFLRRCTAPDPGDRFRDMKELTDALKKIRDRRRRISFTRFPMSGSCILALVTVLILLTAGSCILRERRSAAADRLLEYAGESPDREKKLSFYRDALRKAPWKEEVYAGITGTFILPNHFSQEEAVEIVSLLQETGALLILRRQNPGAYAGFCYEMGAGFFYQMGGSRGKQESEIWFGRALDTGTGLSEDRKKRAECYRLIGEYYRTFLAYGENGDSEKTEGNYRDFFDTLKRLCSYSFGSTYAGEDPGACWYAACEAAMEIRDHAEDFLAEEGISADMLLGELEKARIFARRMPGKENLRKKEELTEMIKEAMKTVRIVEAGDEKTMHDPVDKPSSGSASVSPADEDGGSGSGGDPQGGLPDRREQQ